MLQLSNDQLLTLLGPLAFGDIDDGCQDGRLAVTVDRIESDLDWEFVAIFAPASQVSPNAHQTCFGILHVGRTKTSVFFGSVRTHQKVDRFSKEVFLPVAEQFFHAGL